MTFLDHGRFIGSLLIRTVQESAMEIRQFASKVRTLWGVLLIAAVSSCAGRAPQPVAVVQPQDRHADCPAIFAEVQANNKRIQDLASEQGGKVAQNVAAGVVGLFIWPVWFGMDFQGAAGKEVDALNSRQQYLATLAEQRNCGAPAAPPPGAPPIAVTQPGALTPLQPIAPMPVATAPQPVVASPPPLPLPPVAATPPSTNSLSPPAPLVSNPTPIPSNESYNYEQARRQYEQAKQVYESKLRASTGDKLP
jgi:hypothetical protein